MSIRLMSSIWDSELFRDSSTVTVLLALADCANEDGYCWPSIPKIASKTRLSESTVRRILRAVSMMELGDGRKVLEIEEHRGRKITNRYKLNLAQRKASFALTPVTIEPQIGPQIVPEKQVPEAPKPAPENQSPRQVYEGRENLSLTTENLSLTNVKPVTDDFAIRKNHKESSVKAIIRENPPLFNSSEMAFLVSKKLGLSGTQMALLLRDAIDIVRVRQNCNAEEAGMFLERRWGEYQSAKIQFRVGITRFFQEGRYLQSDSEWGNAPKKAVIERPSTLRLKDLGIKE